ncbi:MAG: AsmA family protein [Sphingomonas fennica]
MTDAARTAGAAPRQPTPRSGRDPAATAIAAIVAVLSTLIGLLLVAWLILFVTRGRFLKGTFERFASAAAERDVRVAGDFQFYFDPIDLKFVADGLSVSNPRWASLPDFFAARHIETRVRTLQLLFGRRRAEYLVLEDGRVDAEWSEDRRNTWTFGDPDAKGEPFEWPVIDRAQVTGTRVRYRDPSLFLSTDIDVGTVRSAETSIENNRIDFTGTGTLRRNPFTMRGALTSPNSTVRFGRTGLVLAARSGGTRLQLSGVLPAATQIENANLLLKVRGPNLRTLFDFLGVAVPDTRGYAFRSHLMKVGGEYRFTRLAGKFGTSDLGGRMTISLPNDRLYIDGDLASRRVDILDIAPFIGYEPNAIATTGVAAAAGAQIGHVRILPDAPLRVDAISNFDAHIDYKVTTVRAPHLPVSDIALTFDLKDRLMKLSPLTMNLSGGALSSDISIDARVPAVVTAYDIRLAPTPMGKLLAGFGVEESGTTGSIAARIQMKGTGDTVRESLASSDGRIAIVLPRGTFWTRNIQLAEFDIGTFVQKMFEDKLKKPVQINCGLIAFTVRNGVAAADPILIDTDKNVMTARGGFSFKDESVDVRFRADSKKFSLFSGQSPVGIGGYFGAPSLRIISPELLARGGAGAALGLAAGPLGAALAFIDVGDAKAAQCGPVLAGATAAQQRTEDGKARKDTGTRAENDRQAASPAEAKPRKKVLGIF